MILVTGASGFLGRHLVRLLSAQGHTVRALYHSNPPADDMINLPRVSWQRYDLLDIYDVEAAMQGVTDLYHCAAVVSFHPQDKERMLHFNVESTANIVNQAIEQGIRKLAYISSIASLGRSEGSKEITEEEQWEESKYNSVYSYSKHSAELEVWRGQAEGLDAVIVNPAVILGESHQWDDGSARLMKVAYQEFPFYTTGINGWVDVQDVASITYQLMQSPVSGERFILCEGNHSYQHIFTRMANALGKKPPRIKATWWMTELVWRWEMLKHRITGKKITITKETARTAQKQNFYNNTKLSAYLPHFAYTPIQHTIERMAKAYLAHKS
ncbi:3-beta hydroxysteroid dehydrogenase [Chitinophagaceae bacterium IBVUCB1]|nr:3-beta hydroxysteroid dehydrogenase [Chitinophagaceae bacterium IBVUCB1]